MVGKSDFNKNPVVSLDLDLDFGLRLRVCQFEKKNLEIQKKIWKFRRKFGNSEKKIGNLENLKLEINNWVIDLT